jgi:threonine dehydrogenase-like Zn-dependent dehydrogenase
MRAVRMTAPRVMELIEMPDPVPKKGEVLVRLTEVAICGSDLVAYLATLPREFPDMEGRPAHECVGIVEKSDMEGFEVGDRVLYFPPGQNGLRQYGIASTPDRMLKLPADGDISEWMMAQLLGTVLHGLRSVGEVMSENVAIVGQGPVGQLFNHMMWNLGAKSVIGIDRVPERLEVSPRMHATHTILSDNAADAVPKVQELTDGLGADVVVEASGYDEAINIAYSAVRRDGRLLQFGAPKFASQQFAVRNIYDKRLKITSTIGPELERDIHQALRYIIEGRVNVKPIITHRFPLDRVHEAYEVYAERQRGCVKVIVEL